MLRTMFRPSRRCVATLLWLAIALLPLRGLASSVMPVAMMGIAAAGADNVAAAMPCHGVEVVADSDSANNAAGCSLCSLCHGSAATIAAPTIVLPTLHGGAPLAAAPPALAPRAPDGLFRPPRTALA